MSVAGPKSSQKNLLLPLKTDSTGNHVISLDQLNQETPARKTLVFQAVKWFIVSPTQPVKGLFDVFFFFFGFFAIDCIYTQYSIKIVSKPQYQGDNQSVSRSE